MTLALRETPDGCTLPVSVHPGAKRNAINGAHDGALKVSLTAALDYTHREKALPAQPAEPKHSASPA